MRKILTKDFYLFAVSLLIAAVVMLPTLPFWHWLEQQIGALYDTFPATLAESITGSILLAITLVGLGWFIESILRRLLRLIT